MEDFFIRQLFRILGNFMQFKGNFGQKHGQLNEFLITRQLNEHRREIVTYGRPYQKYLNMSSDKKDKV